MRSLKAGGSIAGTRVGAADLETLFPVLVLLQKVCGVDKDLGIRNLELEDLVVHGLGRLDSADRLFEIDVKRPQLERLE